MCTAYVDSVENCQGNFLSSFNLGIHFRSYFPSGMVYPKILCKKPKFLRKKFLRLDGHYSDKEFGRMPVGLIRIFDNLKF